MGRNRWKRIVRMELSVLLHSPLHMMLNVHGHAGLSVLVQKQKATIPIHIVFNVRLLSIRNNALQSIPNIVCHRQETASAFGFGFLYKEHPI